LRITASVDVIENSFDDAVYRQHMMWPGKFGEHPPTSQTGFTRYHATHEYRAFGRPFPDQRRPGLLPDDGVDEAGLEKIAEQLLRRSPHTVDMSGAEPFNAHNAFESIVLHEKTTRTDSNKGS
jgi:hypothetical protein